MNDTSMVFLPLPILTFLLCAAICVLMLRLDLGRAPARWCFAALFAVFALASLLVGLRFGYGVEDFIILQRVLPLLVGPLMYLGFSALAVPEGDFAKHASWHLGVAFVTIVFFSLLVGHLGNLDWAIALSYLFYIAALIRLWGKGADTLIHTPFDLAPSVANWMLRGAGLLAFSLIIDAAIAIDFVYLSGNHTKAIISYASIPLILVLLGVIFALPTLVSGPRVKPKPVSESVEDAVQLEAVAREMLVSSQLYLDPELSVQRLARRLHVPVRNLSMAINQSQGMNVSQYVNGFRLTHAAGLLRDTNDSVADVMTRSGFLTRSNFYREFQRVYGQSPARYRQDQVSET